MAKSDWLKDVKAEAAKRFYDDSKRFTAEVKKEKPAPKPKKTKK